MNEYYKSLLCRDLQKLYDILYISFKKAEEKTIFQVNTSKHNFNKIQDDVKAVTKMISLDHPELMWIDTQYPTRVLGSEKNGLIEIELKNIFNYGALKAGVPRVSVNGTTQRERAYNILANMIKTISYDKSEKSQSAFSAGCTHRAICSGYTKYYKCLLDLAGIDCIIIEGIGKNASGSETHAWVSTILDGNQVYIDPTWCDPIINGKQNHIIDEQWFGFNISDGTHVERWEQPEYFNRQLNRENWYDFNIQDVNKSKQQNNEQTNQSSGQNRTGNSKHNNSNTNSTKMVDSGKSNSGSILDSLKGMSPKVLGISAIICILLVLLFVRIIIELMLTFPLLSVIPIATIFIIGAYDKGPKK